MQEALRAFGSGAAGLGLARLVVDAVEYDEQGAPVVRRWRFLSGPWQVELEVHRAPKDAGLRLDVELRPAVAIALLLTQPGRSSRVVLGRDGQARDVPVREGPLRLLLLVHPPSQTEWVLV